MAHNLIQSGHRLVVFDLVDSAMQDAVGAGAQRAGSPAEVRGEENDKYYVLMLVTKTCEGSLSLIPRPGSLHCHK